MNKRTFIRVMVISVLAIGILANFWIFARFTVDDAFITWRYGKNLVLHGIWNYNPSTYDMTQAYTNPIFAYLSVIPAYFGWDVVLFFKSISVAALVVFGVWYTKKAANGIFFVLLAYLMPPTMIHAFGGLETFLFVALSSALLIAIYEESTKGILCFTILLFYTRPEALSLFLCIPILYCNWKTVRYIDIITPGKYKPRNIITFAKTFITAKSILILLILIVAMLPNFVISYVNFGSIIPNTFYVKEGTFSIRKLIIYGIPLLPLLCSCRYLPPKKSISISVFFLLMALQYAKTNFFMDYASRSLFHIVFPVVFFVFYLTNSKHATSHSVTICFDGDTQHSVSCNYRVVCMIAMVLAVATVMMQQTVSELGALADYYWRCLHAHAATGKVIDKIKDEYVIKAIACGDAGMLAYHADVDSLDLYELGSASLTHKGLEETLPLYDPDIVFLHGDKHGVRVGVTQEILDMTALNYIGRIIYEQNYILWAYARNAIPELHQAFQNSYADNNKSHRQTIVEHIFHPPWSQWHE